jgi:hypothetical protein
MDAYFRGMGMKCISGTSMALTALFLLANNVCAQAPAVGTQEFGLTQKQLVQYVERVEAGIAKCMRAQGFEYIAVDYDTVRKGMSADKSLPGVSEDEFIQKHGFGTATMYTGQPPQLTTGYSPARVGLGERNIKIFKSLTPANQAAYNRALLGQNPEATFANGLERENFSRTAGCTRDAIKQVFSAEQISASYYNPKDAIVNKDPRMKAALRKYSAEMRKAGYDYNHPDEVEPDVRKRLDALTQGSTLTVEKMSPEQKAALKTLQDYERRAAWKSFELSEKHFKPVEEQIEKEMFARAVK